jgi:hypothetical protein
MPGFAIGRYFVIWGRVFALHGTHLFFRSYTKLIVDFHLSSAHGFLPPSRRIVVMVSLVDGSKTTTPRSRQMGWRRAGTLGMLAVPATRRCRQAKTDSGNCGKCENVKCSGSASETKGLRRRLAMAKTGGTLAETAETRCTAASFSAAEYRRLISSSPEKLSAISLSHFWGALHSACGNCGNFPDCTAICAFTFVVPLHWRGTSGVAEIAENKFYVAAAHPCGERVRNAILTLRQMCPRRSRHSGAA